jgi:hypothetical protein
MANQVYANNMEVSCKQAAGKSICAFPDVCFTPPQTPATPPGVPIPYPNTGMASDTTDGSRTVKISGQEVMLKNKSYFKKSTGDEAGCAPKKGVVTSKNMGKVYFTMWSMDIKVEGENVVRMLDSTTHNHASLPGNSPPWPYLDEVAVPGITQTCKDEANREKASCSDTSGAYKSGEECCSDPKCQEARQCMLVRYGGPGSPNCCSGKTGHHILPNSLLQEVRADSSTNVPGLKRTGPNAYDVNKGPCVCVTGENHSSGEHGVLHQQTKQKLRAVLEAGGTLSYDLAKAKVAEAHAETFVNPDGKPQCNPDCIAAQIDASLAPARTNGEVKVRQKDGMTRKNFEKFRKTGKKKP